MNRLRPFVTRLRNLVRGRTQSERELHDELHSHLQLHIDDNLRAGLSPEEARRAAPPKLGGLQPTKKHGRHTPPPPLPRPPLRLPHAPPQSRLYGSGRHRPRARHRRQHCALFRRQRRAPPSSSLPATRTTRHPPRKQAQLCHRLHLSPAFPPPAEGQTNVRFHGGHAPRTFPDPHRRRRRRTAQLRHAHLRLLRTPPPSARYTA